MKMQRFSETNYGYKDEPKLIWAEDSSGNIVHVEKVPNGLECNCICPKCRQRLVAKNNKDNERQPHFAHASNSNCHGAYMTAIHKLAEQIIYEEKMVMAPPYGSISRNRLKFTEVELEKRGDRSDLQPDLVGITEDGKRWAIEIRNTNEIDSAKRKKIVESGMICLEIDVRNQEQDKSKLKHFLLLSTDDREWINNPYYDKIIADEDRKKIESTEYCLANAQTLIIPAYDLCICKPIKVKDVMPLKKTEDGLLSIVKVVSKSGIPYIIFISRKETLDTFASSMRGFICDTLMIPIDSLPRNRMIRHDELELSWLYTYSANKIKTIILYELNSNSVFLKKFITYCRKLPGYNPYIIERIYLKEVVDQNVSDLYSQIEDEEKHEIFNYGSNAVEGSLNFFDDENSLECHQSNRSIEDFYSELKLSNTVQIESGLSAKIANMTMIDGKIIVLCEKQREQLKSPFHVCEFAIIHNEIRLKELGSFALKTDAKCVYLTSLFFRSIIGPSDYE